MHPFSYWAYFNNPKSLQIKSHLKFNTNWSTFKYKSTLLSEDILWDAYINIKRVSILHVLYIKIKCYLVEVVWNIKFLIKSTKTCISVQLDNNSVRYIFSPDFNTSSVIAVEKLVFATWYKFTIIVRSVEKCVNVVFS